MSEIENDFVSQEYYLLDALKIPSYSFKIFLKNVKVFFFIFTLIIFPLSLLFLTFSLSSRLLKTQIYQLEALALAAPTRFEGGHLRQESRVDLRTLLRVKLLFFFPIYILSILATITAVRSTALAHSGEHPNFEIAVTTIRGTWKRLSVTMIYVYVLMLAYELVPSTLSVLFVGTACARWVVGFLNVVLEVYLVAVLSIGMVVSVMEERFGWEAVKVGWELMEGRRFCGWVLAGSLVLMSRAVGLRFRVLMDGQDLMIGSQMSFLTKVEFSFLSGLMILWSYVVTTVFYCECTKRHGIKENCQNPSV